MSNDAGTILAAVSANLRTVARNTLPKMYRPDLDNITASTQGGCNTLATDSGFTVRVKPGMTSDEVGEAMFHAAAHYLCNSFNVRSHAASGKHNSNFITAVETLGANAHAGAGGLGGVVIELPEDLSAAARSALDGAARSLAKLAIVTHGAADRVTLKCTDERCSHSITIRRSAAAKTSLTCVEHSRTMTEEK